MAVPVVRIDFSARRRTPLAGWLICGMGAALFGLAADRYADRRDAVEVIEARVARLKARLPNLATSPRSLARRGGGDFAGKQPDTLTPDESPEVNWEKPLDAIGRALGNDVALLQIQQEPRQRRLRLTGEVRDIKDALRFADRLRDSGTFIEVYLTVHDRHKSTGVDVIGFGMQMLWSPDK